MTFPGKPRSEIAAAQVTQGTRRIDGNKGEGHTMWKRSILAILALSIAYAAGCSKKPTNPKVQDTIVPLAVGNLWVYRVTAAAVTSDTQEVVRDTVVNGETWYVMGGTGYDSAHPACWTNRDNGLWVWYGFYADSSSRWLLAKYPSKQGETYDVRPWQWGDVLNVEVESTDAEVTTSAGRYRAHCYRISLGVVSFTRYYFSPSVGLVKWEEWDTEIPEEPSLGRVGELVTIHLK
jgi:hypothetical protein